MHINDLPQEILSDILLLAAKANEEENAQFTYGLGEVEQPFQKAKLTKYVRGPLSAESLRWDATCAMRQVCHQWHEWSLSYNLEHVLERKWQGGERWTELTLKRNRYSFYEMMNDRRLSGHVCFQHHWQRLMDTDRLFSDVPAMANHVRRLWFNGFHATETDKLILSIVSHCTRLRYLTVPWTILRRATAEDWVNLLNAKTGSGNALESLELTAQCLPHEQAAELEHAETPSPLTDRRVDFSSLKRLKIFGNTLHKPICDADMHLIARTATNLECLDITNLSTISVAGMLALVRASSQTLQVLEHSPRSDDGFYHPFPGHLESGEHICELIASLPKMRDLSLSIPHMCSALFANHDVQWAGELQVRATDICGCDSTTTPAIRVAGLQQTLTSVRKLLAHRRRMGHVLSAELFFAGCIFQPEKKLVHGDFTLAEIRSNGRWPESRQSSTRGPYGNTGTYGKEEGLWDAVSEDAFTEAVTRGWIDM